MVWKPGNRLIILLVFRRLKKRAGCPACLFPLLSPIDRPQWFIRLFLRTVGQGEVVKFEQRNLGFGNSWPSPLLSCHVPVPVFSCPRGFAACCSSAHVCTSCTRKAETGRIWVLCQVCYTARPDLKTDTQDPPPRLPVYCWSQHENFVPGVWPLFLLIVTPIRLLEV